MSFFNSKIPFSILIYLKYFPYDYYKQKPLIGLDTSPLQIKIPVLALENTPLWTEGTISNSDRYSHCFKVIVTLFIILDLNTIFL